MLTVVPIATRGRALDIGMARPLSLRLPGLHMAQYDVLKDGRILARVAASDQSVNVIVNWFELKRGRPTS